MVKGLTSRSSSKTILEASRMASRFPSPVFPKITVLTFFLWKELWVRHWNLRIFGRSCLMPCFALQWLNELVWLYSYGRSFSACLFIVCMRLLVFVDNCWVDKMLTNWSSFLKEPFYADFMNYNMEKKIKEIRDLLVLYIFYVNFRRILHVLFFTC